MRISKATSYRRFGLLAPFLCLMLWAIGYPAFADKNLALVIGNASYLNSPLKNPVNDANDMASTLRTLGFEVMLHIDANRNKMRRAIRDFGNGLSRAEIGLFYYAGHGVQVRDRNYLIPIGADIFSEDDVTFESLDVGRVLGKMEWAQNPVNIIILDACRNNPFARSFRSAAQGLARVESPVGSLVVYATAPNQTAADGEGDNGVFTGSLIKYLSEPGLSLDEVVLKTRVDVMKATQKKQVPWSSSSLTKSLVLLPREQPAASESGKVAALLKVCNTHLAANRLTTGVGGSALACFESVLEMEPFSFEALNGIDQITQGYIMRATSAVGSGRLGAARRYLDTIIKINPDHPAVDELEVALADLADPALLTKATEKSGSNEEAELSNSTESSAAFPQPESGETIVAEFQPNVPSGSGAGYADTVVDESGGEAEGPEEVSVITEGDGAAVAKAGVSDLRLNQAPGPAVLGTGDKEQSEPDELETVTVRDDPESETEELQAEQLRPERLLAEELRAEELRAEELRAEELRAEELRAEELQVAAITKESPPRKLCPDCSSPGDWRGNQCIELQALSSELVPAEPGHCFAQSQGQCVDNQYRFKVRNICKKPMYLEWVFDLKTGSKFDSEVLKKSEEKVITCLKQQQGCTGAIRYAWKKQSK